MNTKLMKTSRTSLTSHIIEDGEGRTLCGAVPTERWVEGDSSKICSRCENATPDPEEPLFEVEFEVDEPSDAQMNAYDNAQVTGMMEFVRSSKSAVVTHILDKTQPVTACGIEINTDWLSGPEAFIEGKVCSDCLSVQYDVTPIDESEIFDLTLRPSKVGAIAYVTPKAEIIPAPAIEGEIVEPELSEEEFLNKMLTAMRSVQTPLLTIEVTSIKEIRHKERAFLDLYERPAHVTVAGSWGRIWSIAKNKWVDRAIEAEVVLTDTKRDYFETRLEGERVLLHVDGIQFVTLS